MGRTMHLSLRAGERVFINGAVLRVDRKVGIELLNDAAFLLEGHVLQAEEATTPLRQLYFAAQTLLIDPANAGPARDLCAGLRAGILAATRDAAIHAGLAAVQGLIEADRPFEALKAIRGLYPAEAALLAASGAAPAPAPPALRAGPEAAPRRPRGWSAPAQSPAVRFETRPRRSAGPGHTPVPVAARAPRLLTAGLRPDHAPEPEI